MKTIISYNGTDGDIFFSMVHNKVFLVEYDWEELIGLYDGRMYYFSKSLLSGEGFLNGLRDLIKINNHFPANFKNTSIFKIFYNEENRKNIYCFVDAGYSHKQFDGNVVLTDGSSVAICDEKSVVSIVNGWETVDWKKGYIYGYSPKDGDPFKVEFNYKIKINPARFLQDIVPFCECEHPLVFHPRINLYKIGESYFHRNKVGFFDKKWDFDPTQVVGENIGNWVVFHPGVVYARYDNMVAWITASDRKTFCQGKYSFEEGGSVPLLDYEATCSVWGFFDKTPEYFSFFLLKKAREDFVFSSKRMSVEMVKRMLEEHQKDYFVIEDSFEVGNCATATNEFIKKFNVKENEGGLFDVKDILENQHLEEMLGNFNFRKVIANKFT